MHPVPFRILGMTLRDDPGVARHGGGHQEGVAGQVVEQGVGVSGCGHASGHLAGEEEQQTGVSVSPPRLSYHRLSMLTLLTLVSKGGRSRRVLA